MTFVGPALVPIELGGRKVLALFGRAEARDFTDVFELSHTYGKAALISKAAEIDRGFKLNAWRAKTTDRLSVKKSKSSDGRLIKPNARRADPPARRYPADSFSEKNSRATST
jgi:predicted nucleotidyltransferase component of viral defense system